MNKSKLIKDTLRFGYRHSQRAIFRLKNENIVPIAQSILSAIDECNESVLPDNVVTLKQSPGKRIIFRINSSKFAQESFVAKVFLLHRFKHKLKYHWMKYQRYAFNEAANLIIAAHRGLNVPKVYGYGYTYGLPGLIKTSIVILEDLVQLTSVDELLRVNRVDEEKCAKILSRTIPVFVKLHKTMCHIVYILSDAIMLGSEGSNQDAFVLDFEYAKFHNKPSLEILMYEAAYFAQSCPDFLTERIIYDWVAKLLDAVEIGDNANRRKLIERFNYYFVILPLSHKETVEIC